jgi:hypothetical protein
MGGNNTCEDNTQEDDSTVSGNSLDMVGVGLDKGILDTEEGLGK